MDILPIDYEIDEFSPRFSQNNTINANGCKLLEFCKLNYASQMVAFFGADKGVGKYTYVGSTGSSVIDYVIVNSDLLDMIRSFYPDPNVLSDHCSIDFSMSCKHIDESVNTGEKVTFEKVNKQYFWSEERAGECAFSLEKEENSLRDLSQVFLQMNTPQQINDNILNFSILKEKVCDPLFDKKKKCIPLGMKIMFSVMSLQSNLGLMKSAVR